MSRAVAGLALLVGCRLHFDDRPRSDGASFDPANCPATYSITLPATTTRYRPVATFDTWQVAAADCADDLSSPVAFTHLAVIGSEPERIDFTTIAGTLGSDPWIGLSDRRTEGTFLWVTAENTNDYPTAPGPFWEPGEPNDANDVEDCAHHKPSGAYNDNSCDAVALAYVCECDNFSNDPARY